MGSVRARGQRHGSADEHTQRAVAPRGSQRQEPCAREGTQDRIRRAGAGGRLDCGLRIADSFWPIRPHCPFTRQSAIRNPQPAMTCLPAQSVENGGMAHTPRPTPRLSRRSFLQTSVGVTILAAAPTAARAGTRGQSAADSVGVGFIGAGIRGEILMRTTQAIAGTRIVSVADVYDGHLDRARELAGPSVQTGRDYRKLLDNPDVQAVVIAVPDHWHKQMALDPRTAGKEV